MMKKQIMILLIGLVMVILLNGCGSAKKETDPILAAAADITNSVTAKNAYGAYEKGIVILKREK